MPTPTKRSRSATRARDVPAHPARTARHDDAPRTQPARGRLLARAALAAAALCLLPAGAPGDEEAGAGARIGDARAVLDKWVETQRLISEERRDWALGRELLGDRVELMEREIASLRDRITEAQGSVTEADRQLAELQSRADRYAQAAAALAGVVTALEGRTRALLARLPEPVRERVAPISQRLPDDPGQTKASLSERFLTVVGVLNAVNKFHRDITLTSEVRTLGDGSTAEVVAMYVGIGHAYFVSGDGGSGGVGRSTEQGWTWEPADEAAASIAEAVAIQKNEETAAFVRLPVRVE